MDAYGVPQDTRILRSYYIQDGEGKHVVWNSPGAKTSSRCAGFNIKAKTKFGKYGPKSVVPYELKIYRELRKAGCVVPNHFAIDTPDWYPTNSKSHKGKCMAREIGIYSMADIMGYVSDRKVTATQFAMLVASEDWRYYWGSFIPKCPEFTRLHCEDCKKFYARLGYMMNYAFVTALSSWRNFHVLGTLTPDNVDLFGNIYDYEDLFHDETGMYKGSMHGTLIFQQSFWRVYSLVGADYINRAVHDRRVRDPLGDYRINLTGGGHRWSFQNYLDFYFVNEIYECHNLPEVPFHFDCAEMEITDGVPMQFLLYVINHHRYDANIPLELIKPSYDPETDILEYYVSSLGNIRYDHIGDISPDFIECDVREYLRDTTVEVPDDTVWSYIGSCKCNRGRKRANPGINTTALSDFRQFYADCGEACPWPREFFANDDDLVIDFTHTPADQPVDLDSFNAKVSASMTDFEYINHYLFVDGEFSKSLKGLSLPEALPGAQQDDISFNPRATGGHPFHRTAAQLIKEYPKEVDKMINSICFGKKRYAMISTTMAKGCITKYKDGAPKRRGIITAGYLSNRIQQFIAYRLLKVLNVPNVNTVHKGGAGLSQFKYERHVYNPLVGSAPEDEFQYFSLDFPSCDSKSESCFSLITWLVMIQRNTSIPLNARKNFIACVAASSLTQTLIGIRRDPGMNMGISLKAQGVSSGSCATAPNNSLNCAGATRAVVLDACTSRSRVSNPYLVDRAFENVYTGGRWSDDDLVPTLPDLSGEKFAEEIGSVEALVRLAVVGDDQQGAILKELDLTIIEDLYRFGGYIMNGKYEPGLVDFCSNRIHTVVDAFGTKRVIPVPKATRMLASVLYAQSKSEDTYISALLGIRRAAITLCLGKELGLDRASYLAPYAIQYHLERVLTGYNSFDFDFDVDGIAYGDTIYAELYREYGPALLPLMYECKLVSGTKELIAQAFVECDPAKVIPGLSEISDADVAPSPGDNQDADVEAAARRYVCTVCGIPTNYLCQCGSGYCVTTASGSCMSYHREFCNKPIICSPRPGVHKVLKCYKCPISVPEALYVSTTAKRIVSCQDHGSGVPMFDPNGSSGLPSSVAEPLLTKDEFVLCSEHVGKGQGFALSKLVAGDFRFLNMFIATSRRNLEQKPKRIACTPIGYDVQGTIFSAKPGMLKNSSRFELGGNPAVVTRSPDGRNYLVDRVISKSSFELVDVTNIDLDRICNTVLNAFHRQPVCMKSFVQQSGMSADVHVQKLAGYDLYSNIVYLWGAPGTGKTYQLFQYLIQVVLQKKKVVLVSDAHANCDDLTAKLGEFQVYDKLFREQFVIWRYRGDNVPGRAFKRGIHCGPTEPAHWDVIIKSTKSAKTVKADVLMIDEASVNSPLVELYNVAQHMRDGQPSVVFAGDPKQRLPISVHKVENRYANFYVHYAQDADENPRASTVFLRECRRCPHEVTKVWSLLFYQGNVHSLSRQKGVVEVLCSDLDADLISAATKYPDADILASFWTEVGHIKNLLENHAYHRVCTIDSYQGSEHDDIILYLPTSLRVMTKYQRARLNVGLSRCKKTLTIVSTDTAYKTLFGLNTNEALESEAMSLPKYPALQNLASRFANSGWREVTEAGRLCAIAADVEMAMSKSPGFRSTNSLVQVGFRTSSRTRSWFCYPHIPDGQIFSDADTKDVPRFHAFRLSRNAVRLMPEELVVEIFKFVRNLPGKPVFIMWDAKFDVASLPASEDTAQLCHLGICQNESVFANKKGLVWEGSCSDHAMIDADTRFANAVYIDIAKRYDYLDGVVQDVPVFDDFAEPARSSLSATHESICAATHGKRPHDPVSDASMTFCLWKRQQRLPHRYMVHKRKDRLDTSKYNTRKMLTEICKDIPNVVFGGGSMAGDVANNIDLIYDRNMNEYVPGPGENLVFIESADYIKAIPQGSLVARSTDAVSYDGDVGTSRGTRWAYDFDNSKYSDLVPYNFPPLQNCAGKTTSCVTTSFFGTSKCVGLEGMCTKHYSQFVGLVDSIQRSRFTILTPCDGNVEGLNINLPGYVHGPKGENTRSKLYVMLCEASAFFPEGYDVRDGKTALVGWHGHRGDCRIRSYLNDLSVYVHCYEQPGKCEIRLGTAEEMPPNTYDVIISDVYVVDGALKPLVQKMAAALTENGVMSFKITVSSFEQGVLDVCGGFEVAFITPSTKKSPTTEVYVTVARKAPHNPALVAKITRDYHNHLDQLMTTGYPVPSVPRFKVIRFLLLGQYF